MYMSFHLASSGSILYGIEEGRDVAGWVEKIYNFFLKIEKI